MHLTPPPARKMIEKGVPVAVASDFNPNAYCMSMPFAGQMCLLRFVQLSELPKGLPLAAGVLVLCMVLQCIRLAARSEYIAEA